MGVAHCGTGICQSGQAEECTICSKVAPSTSAELDAQGYDGVFSSPSLPAPVAAKPCVEHFNAGCGRILERHALGGYLVVQAENREVADRLVEEFETQRLKRVRAPPHLSLPKDEEATAGTAASSSSAVASYRRRQGAGLRPLKGNRDAPPDAGPRREHRDQQGTILNRSHCTYKNGASYVGEWAQEGRHGRGVQKWPDGSRYEGQWVHDRVEGEGRFIRPRGDIYEGQFKADKVHGQGLFRPTKGAVYEGQWEDDLQHGDGEEVWPDGVRYKGQFRAGTKSGSGRFTWPNGSYYEGCFADNLIHGFGYHQWHDGRSYRGQWVQEKMHGAGTFSFPDGRSYEGQYVDDLKHGFGMFRWPDGRRYEGQWSEGRQHGFATYHAASGDMRSGEWEHGKWLRWTGTPEAGEGKDQLPCLLQKTRATDRHKKHVSPSCTCLIKRRPSSQDISKCVHPTPEEQS